MQDVAGCPLARAHPLAQPSHEFLETARGGCHAASHSVPTLVLTPTPAGFTSFLESSHMHVRSTLLSLAVTTGLGAGLLVGTPAQAAFTTTVSEPDTSRVGHVKAQVATDAPYAYTAIVDGATVLGRGSPTSVSGGGLSVDQVTWGLRTDRSYTLQVHACPTISYSGCDVTPVEFTPTDVAPEATWREDRLIGPGELPSVTISDPEGNQQFSVAWDVTPSSRHALGSGGGTFYGPEGRHVVSLLRCSSLGCNPTGQSAEFVLDRSFTPQPVWVEPEFVHPDDTSAPEGTIRFSGMEGADSYWLDYHLVRWSTGETVPGSERVIPEIPHELGHQISVDLDLTGLPDGRYTLEGALGYDSPDFGTVTALVEHTSVPRIDTTDPTFSDVNVRTHELYPARDDYLDEYKVSMRTQERGGDAFFEFRDSSGALVATAVDSLSGGVVGTWKGRDDDDNRVPAGTYTVRVRAVDRAGHTTVLPLGKVRVSDKRVRHIQAYITRSAKRSLVDSWTGRCSRIVSGGSRNWDGALGLVSNATCTSSTWRGSGVATVQAVKAPRGWIGGQVSIHFRSGAARTRPGSLAFGELWGAEQAWIKGHNLASRIGWHGWHWFQDHKVLQENNRIYIRIATLAGHRYDIGDMNVAFEGAVLR